MKFKCTNPECGKEFDSTRSDAKYCSQSCRTKVFRDKGNACTLEPDKVMDEMNQILSEGQAESADQTIRSLDEVYPIQMTNITTKKHLLTGRTTPGLAYPGWSRPKYWLRLRDLPEDEQGPFHAFLKGRNNPVDPTLPSDQQDFYHPWAYTEWKNPEVVVSGAFPTVAPKNKPAWLDPMLIPPDVPWDDGSAHCMKERLRRLKEYNETMDIRHQLTESKLRHLLKRSGYSPDLAKHAFPKVKPPTALPE